MALLGLLAASDFDPTREWGSQRLEAELVLLSTNNADLALRTREMERVVASMRSDNEVMEKAAREDLGYLREGEVIIVLPQ